MQNSNTNGAFDWVFGRPQLSRLLRACREQQGASRDDIQARLVGVLRDLPKDPRWDAFRSLVDPKQGGSVSKLESPAASEEVLRLPDIEPLARAYRIHLTMFSSLLSRSLRHMYIAHDPAVDFQEIESVAARRIGEKTRYSYPPTRLSGTDSIAVVCHELEPSGHSAPHNHPGDEFVYVEGGTVQVRLEDTGLRTTLEQGSFIHFEAGQLHDAWNLSGEHPARMFVVRFLQLHAGTQPDLLRELRSGRPSEKFTRRIIEETKLSTWTVYPEQACAAPSEVLDPYGFGRFLDLLCSPTSLSEENRRVTFDDLVRISKSKGLSYSRSRFVRLHHGEIQVKKEELPALADIYGVTPALFYNFLFPAFRYAIAVHDEKDMSVLPTEFVTREEVVYSVPRRRLAHSDTTVAVMRLDPGASTMESRHPGYEILKPLEGQVAVEFGSTKNPEIKAGAYAIFYSGIDHRVCNRGQTPARVLVLRLME